MLKDGTFWIYIISKPSMKRLRSCYKLMFKVATNFAHEKAGAQKNIPH